MFGVFSLAQDLLREQPVQAQTRQDLRAKLANRPSGGIVFATIQKFMPGEDEDVFPRLSDRRNIVVIADEAHRSQYGFAATLKTVGRVSLQGVTRQAAAEMSGYAALTRPTSTASTAANDAQALRVAEPAAVYQVGYAQHLRNALPNATFVAFTGTPVSSEDRV